MNKSSTTNPIKILRAALLLLTMLLPAAAALADDFITDVLVVGNSNQTQFNNLISSLVEEGWTDIPQDLNQGCGSGSAYIHLLYKRQSSTANTGTAITGFYIRTGSNPPDNLTHEGHTYYLVPCQGSESFVNGHGDLNAGCGSGSAYIFLYYTKEVMSDNKGVTEVFFNSTQSGAVGANGGTTGYDLNSGGGGAYIYMHLTTASGGNVVTLTSGSGDMQLLNGHILTGTGGADTRVSVTDGATVTFSGVNITAIPSNSSYQWPGIHCSGNATIVLNGSTTNSVQGGYRNPGIYVAQNKTLTIQGSGTLNATGSNFASGIGSGFNQSPCGNITISGGTVNATGQTYAAGIGSGYQSSCGNITISGGTVTANGGYHAAAIGSGTDNASCGDISITNGVTCVTAIKDRSYNTVGAGDNSTCGTVTIGGVLLTGPITMSPFVTYPYTVHFNNNGGTGTMTDQAFMYNVAQNLTANAFSNGGREFLGWATSANGPIVYSNGQSVSNLTQNAGATVTLYAKWGNTVTLTSQIGEVLLQNGETLTGTGGSNTRVKIADGATVNFSGVNNTAIPLDENHQWPGIHCLGNATIVLNGNTTNSVKGGFRNPGIYVAANKTLTIQGSGTLNATGGNFASGIGSGFNQSPCGNITISGGTVNAIGQTQAAGIGSGYQSSCGTITISGGTVTAHGGYRAAAIGSGYSNASCGNITITNGVTHVTATKDSSNNSVGAGNNSTCGTITIGGVLLTGPITMSPFVTYPYTVHFDANGGTGTMANQAFMYNVAQGLTQNAFTKAGWEFQGWATSANGSTVYTNGQIVSNLTDTIATVTLYAKWTPHLSVDGNTYTIHTATGWDLFCNLLAENNNGYFTGKTVKLANSISVTTMAGSPGHEFSGTFDGQSHTLTVSYQNTDGTVRTAPFSYVNGATIKNLIVAGSITGTGNRAAGIVGETVGSLSHITNCVSSVNVSGGNYTAGISIGGNVEITGCVYNGMITGTSMSGGFVGYSDSTLVISNSLFAPQAGSSINGGTFYYNGGGDITPVNSYYTMPLGTSQGKQARSIVGGDYVTVAFNGEATAYNTSGISAYSVGMVYGNTLYAGNGETVSLNLSCTPPSGYVLSSYTASAGTLTGTANPYTLTMPNEAVTIQAVVLEQLDPVAYIDEDGEEQECTSYTIVTNELDFEDLSAGWYVVNDNITIESNVHFTSDAHLILCDDATMSVSDSVEEALHADGYLTLFGQSEGTGSLTATSNHYHGIVANNLTINGCTVTATGYNGIGISANDLTINGSTVIASASGYGSGINANMITVNSGTVTASGSSNGIYTTNVNINGGTVTATGGIHDGINAVVVTINGGTVNATGILSGIKIGNASGYVTINGGTLTANEIYSPMVTLGWSNLNDRITVGSYTYNSTFTVSVKSGQVLLYENNGEIVTISGTLNGNQINAIGGKTLFPNLSSVAYVDGNGEPHTCINYTVLEGGETMLEAGWYVVDHDISYHNTITLNGNVNLILCNGKTMTVGANGEGNGGIKRVDNKSTGNLTIYSQSLNSSEAGTLRADPDRSRQFESGFNFRVASPSGDWNPIKVSHYTQHSGNVIARHPYQNAISANRFTLHGGTVTANGQGSGITTDHEMIVNGGTINATSPNYGIHASGNVTINSGTVNATGNSGIKIGNASGCVTINGGTVTTNRIYSPTITLGWSDTTDRIAVSNFTYSGTPTVSVKSGQALCYIDNGNKHSTDTVIISGTLDEAQIEAIGGKILSPYCLTPVPYIDENGVEQQCTFYTIVTNELDFDDLPAGWYVVNNNITRNSQVQFSGDAHLILCDSTTMNISCYDDALNTYSSLTLYGQSGGTGSLTASSNHLRGISASNLTINGCTVNATANHNSEESIGILASNLTINGSTVTASGNEVGINSNLTINGSTVTAIGSVFYGIRADYLIINGSTVNATGNDSGIKIDYASGYVTINGGTVTATGDYGIYSPTVTLGWSNTTDRITVDSFAYDSTPTVSVKNGQTLCYIEESGETFVVSGTLNTEEIAAISGKTLRPYVVARTVPGFGQGNGGWALIASPFGEINPLNVTGMLSDNHDLYAFVPNPSDLLEWRNYATDTFNLIAGMGYLYANADTVTLVFSGTPYSGNGEFALVYDSTDARKCWNLVGNPFPFAVYLDREYYVLNADGTDIDPEPIPASVPVPPCEAVLVKAVGVDDKAVFSLEEQP